MDVAALAVRQLRGRDARGAGAGRTERSGAPPAAVPVEKLGRLLLVEDALRACRAHVGIRRYNARSDGHFPD